MVMPEFTARRTREMRPLVRELVDELLDQMADLPRPVDFATAFAVQLPCLVIARIFGVPDEDIAFFKQQSALILAQDRGPEVPLAAYQAMSDYLGELARAKARRPGDDLISRLAVEYGAAARAHPRRPRRHRPADDHRRSRDDRQPPGPDRPGPPAPPRPARRTARRRGAGAPGHRGGAALLVDLPGQHRPGGRRGPEHRRRRHRQGGTG
ncbi:hypothetical protein GCM10020000_70940 [Streptomyces olivoverticillatus]